MKTPPDSRGLPLFFETSGAQGRAAPAVFRREIQRGGAVLSGRELIKFLQGRVKAIIGLEVIDDAVLSGSPT